MCLISTFSGPDSRGTVEGNDHPGHALVYFDFVQYYPGARFWANGGDALTPVYSGESRALQFNILTYFLFKIGKNLKVYEIFG